MADGSDFPPDGLTREERRALRLSQRNPAPSIPGRTLKKIARLLRAAKAATDQGAAKRKIKRAARLDPENGEHYLEQLPRTGPDVPQRRLPRYLGEKRRPRLI